MKRLCALFIIICTFIHSNAQEPEWKTVSSEELGFETSMYGDATHEMKIYFLNGVPLYHYKWESNAEKDYQFIMEVFVLPDSLTIDTSSLEEYQEKIYTDELLNANKEILVERSYKPIGEYTFEYYSFQSKDKKKKSHYQTGIVANKLYKQSLHITSSDGGFYEAYVYIDSFKLLNPPSLSAQIAEFNPTFEIDFPETVQYEARVTEDSTIVISATHIAAQPKRINEDKINIVVLEESIFPIEEGIIPADSVRKPDPEPDPSGELAEYYSVFETQYAINLESLNEEGREYFFDLMREQMVRMLNGKLVTYKTINTNSVNGKEIVVRSMYDNIYIFNAYLSNNSSYLVEVKLVDRAQKRNDKIKAFLESFRLKK